MAMMLRSLPPSRRRRKPRSSLPIAGALTTASFRWFSRKMPETLELFDHGDRTVFLVPESDSVEDKIVKIALWTSKGIVSEGCRALTPEEWKKELEARRAKDCFCQLIECVCNQVRDHKEDCHFRKAMICAVPISCQHGVDVCPQCDPCSCQKQK